MLWMKHNTLATKWCTGADNAGTFASFCNGRWGTHDPDFARADDPPHEDRCEACERVRIDRRLVERGLAELRASMTYTDYPSAHELDDGGES